MKAWMTAAGVAIATAATGADLVYTADPGKMLNRVERGIYGHFLEHIYHSCNGGLWGDVVWNRSFEDGAAGNWHVADGEVVQKGRGADQRLVFGEAAWTDYELSFEAQKTGGAEGFLAMVRTRGPKEFYWVNLGGWGNKHHQIEKCMPSRERQGPVGPRAEGIIEAGRWYRIKVRCEGARIRVTLDDREIIDFTDPDPIPAGAPGLGTWATQARFRNIKVAALDGRTLFEGLPSPGPTVFAARHWSSFGPGAVTLETGDALNGETFARIRNGDDGAAESGLRQSNVCARAGDILRGTLWVRGKSPKGLALRLASAGRALAGATVPVKPGDTWVEVSVSLTPSADAPDAVLEVAAAGGSDLCIDQISLMPDSSAAAGGFRPDLLKAIADLRPPVIRWPGGCYAEEYRWKDGIGPQSGRGAFPKPMWDDVDVNSLGTDEFIDLCRRTGAEPLIVINTGRFDPETPRAEYVREALDWMEYCNGPADSKWGAVRAKNGHPEPYNVKLWEIDNETWESGIETYIEVVREFAPAMRKAHPSVTLLACGGDGANLNSHGGWDPKLIDACADLFDVLSIHHYENPARFADGPARDERWYRDLQGLIAKSKNPKLKLYVSEWNAQSTDWRTGLYAGGILNAFERSGDVVTLAAPALFLRHVSARAWDNALVNFDACGWFPAPNYVVMKLWYDHYAPERISLEGPESPLSVVATRDDKGRVILKAVNPSDAPADVVVKLAGGAVRSASLVLVAPGSLEARNTLAAPAAVAPRPGDARVAEGAARFTLPPLSAGVAVLER
jgi:alpha-N-arabinofuranosidase